jgi:predicted nucleic acid-binding protein
LRIWSEKEEDKNCWLKRARFEKEPRTLYFEEDASERAVRAANEYSPITLDLAVAEVGNAAWKRVAFFKENKDATLLSLSKCLLFIKSCTIMNSSDLAGSAYEIALENKTTFYDSLFLAAAQQGNVPLLTLDKKMYVAAKAKNNIQML